MGCQGEWPWPVLQVLGNASLGRREAPGRRKQTLMWEERGKGSRHQALPCTRESQALHSKSEWAEAPGLGHLPLQGSGMGDSAWITFLRTGSHAGSQGPHITWCQPCH